LIDAAEDAESSDAEPVEESPGDATVAVTDASMQEAAAAKTSAEGGHACYTRTSAGNAGSTTCINNLISDPVLSIVLNQVNSTTSSNVLENEAGEVVTDEAGVTQGGGNSGVDTQYLQNAAAGETVSGEGTGSYTVKGLTNGNYYAVAVSAVDAFGNVGPPSTPQACDYPAPVSDFWAVYRENGGHASGLCTLEAVGASAASTAAFASLGAAGVALLRRRRQSRKR
jgi:MYXO-CTERM domain-containing protein